jgi:hypothetical protein
MTRTTRVPPPLSCLVFERVGNSWLCASPRKRSLALIAIRPLFSPVPHIILDQLLKACYPYAISADQFGIGAPLTMPLHREVPQILLTARPFTPLARSSSTLPSLSFQSLTNCPRFVIHSQSLSFQPVTNCPTCRPFVLKLIQHAGDVGTPFAARPGSCISVFSPSSPLFSKSCALFCATFAMHLSWNQ